MAKADKQKEDLLKELKGRFCRDLKAHKEWCSSKKVCDEFYDGDQWTDEERKVLRSRNQPDVTINRTKPKIDSIIGMEAGLKVNTKAFDRGTQDFETAKFISEALRQVEYLNDFDTTENLAFGDQIIAGRGYYEVSIKWDGLEADPDIKRLYNEDVVRDCDGREADLSDSNHIHKSIWTSIEKAKMLFPECADELDACMESGEEVSITDGNGRGDRPDQYAGASKDGATAMAGDYSDFVDKKLKQIRLTTTQYRVPFKRSFLTAKGLGVVEITGMSEGDIAKTEENFENAVKWDQLGYRVNVATYCWNEILEQKEDIRPYDKDGKFSIVFVPGFPSRSKDKSHLDYGLVKQMLDPQREVNKRRSKMLHILSTNSIMVEEGAIDDVQKLRTEAAKPDGLIILRPGAFNKIMRETRTDLAASQFQLLQEAKNEIDSVGIRGEVEGQSEATSGRDFQLRQQQATQSMRQLFSNLRAARRRVFLLVLDIIQQHWTSQRLVRITDDPDAGAIVLNQTVKDPTTGEEIVQNDVSLGKYDLIIEEAPETVTLQGETFEILAGLAEKGYPIPMDMLIESSPIPNKKKLLEKMQQQAQAQQMAAQQAASAGAMAPA